MFLKTMPDKNLIFTRAKRFLEVERMKKIKACVIKAELGETGGWGCANEVRCCTSEKLERKLGLQWRKTPEK